MYARHVRVTGSARADLPSRRPLPNGGSGSVWPKRAGIGEAALAGAIGATAVIPTPMCTMHPGPGRSSRSRVDVHESTWPATS